MAWGTHGSGAAAGPWLLVAATSPAAAGAHAATNGLDVAAIVERVDVVAAHGRLDRLAARHGATAIAVHSVDWSREEMPQLYTLALARSRGLGRYLIDESIGDAPRALSAGRILAGAASVAPQLVAGAARAGVELGGSPLRSFASGRRSAAGGNGTSRRSVLFYWPGTTQTSVGGSVTHAAGILSGFASLGLRVVIVSSVELPEQLAAVADRVSVLPPLPASSRLTREAAALLVNPPLRRAIASELESLDAPLVYARHRGMLTAPLEVARRSGVPSVLEWNSSERWAIDRWTRSPEALKRLSLPLVERLERAVVREADLVAPVSRAAAAMAIDAGADPGRLLISPNATDPAAIDAEISLCPEVAARERSVARIGWIGSFGPWHGADVLVRAAAAVRGGPELLMIGDGVERAGCERLAAELGAGDRVRFAGRLPHTRAMAELSRCDLLVASTAPLPAGEPFVGSPTKVFEYMALGKPIVASALGQTADVLEDGRTARLVEPGDAGELTAAIEELLDDPDRAAELGREARREAEANHSWSHRAAAILEALGG